MPKRLKGVANLPFPPIVAGLYGIVAGFLVFSTPQWLFEHWIDMSGVANFIPAAAPPLGEKARLLSAGASVVGVALLLWPLLAMGQSLIRKMRKKEVVHVRARGIVVADSLDTAYVPPLDLQADAPDFRTPIFAEGELGAPLMSDAALEAADELVLQDSIDGPLLATRGQAMPSASVEDDTALPPLANFAPNLAEEAAAILADDRFALPVTERLSQPPVPSIAVSQFQLPGDDEPEAEELVAIAPFDLDAMAAEVAQEPVIDLPFAVEPAAEPEIAAMEPAEDPLFGTSFRLPRRDDAAPAAPESFNALASEEQKTPPMLEPIIPPAPVAATLDPFALPGRSLSAPASDADGLSFSTMRVNLGRSVAPPVEIAEPAAPEPAPVFAPEPARVEAVVTPIAADMPQPSPATTPVGDTVAGLMDRLNAAMGARLRKPAAPEPAPTNEFDRLHMSLGLGGRRAF